MKNLYQLIIPLFLLTGCLGDEKQDVCFDIINSTMGHPNQPILINKCSGETWMVIREEYIKQPNELTPDYVLRWYRVDRTIEENSIAGIKKPNYR